MFQGTTAQLIVGLNGTDIDVSIEPNHGDLSLSGWRRGSGTKQRNGLVHINHHLVCSGRNVPKCCFIGFNFAVNGDSTAEPRGLAIECHSFSPSQARGLPPTNIITRAFRNRPRGVNAPSGIWQTNERRGGLQTRISQRFDRNHQFTRMIDPKLILALHQS